MLDSETSRIVTIHVGREMDATSTKKIYSNDDRQQDSELLQ